MMSIMSGIWQSKGKGRHKLSDIDIALVLVERPSSSKVKITNGSFCINWLFLIN